MAAWAGPKPKGQKQSAKAFKAGTYATVEVEAESGIDGGQALALRLISASSLVGDEWTGTTLPQFGAEHVNAYQGIGKSADHVRGIWYDEGPGPGAAPAASMLVTGGVMISVNRNHKSPAQLKQELTGIAAVEVPAVMKAISSG
ncbi:MAG: hypothetical protein ACYDHN_14120 [Solirubrobacteraceae bacterium]